MKNTKHWSSYWANRKADWNKSYLSTENHPHRKLLVGILKDLPWNFLLEIGCNAGPNLLAILKAIPGRQVGGVDINADSIAEAKKHIRSDFLKVYSADDILISDDAMDVILSDMTLIYVSRGDIDRYVKEMKRISKYYVLLCEFHSTSWWNRLALDWNRGYKAYNWKKLLEKHGFYDVVVYKLKPEEWDGHEPQKTFAHIILAKVPQT